MVEEVEELTRTIQFYQVVWGRRSGDAIRKDNAFFDSMLANICGVSEAESAYDESLESYDRANLGVTDTNKSFYKISKIRKTDLPLKHDYTSDADLPLGLEADEGLTEPSHLVVLNGVLIGVEYNHYAPRMPSVLVKKINDHLKTNPVEDLIRVEITPVLKEGMLERIDRIREISSIYIKIATDYAKIISQEDDRLRTMLAAADLTQDAYLKIEFSVGQGRKLKPASAFGQILTIVKTIISRTDSMGSIADAQIKGKEIGSATPEKYDLLEEMLVTKRQIAKIDEKTRAVDSIEMYKAILDAYNSLNSYLVRFNPI
jgi:hypothetical protein